MTVRIFPADLFELHIAFQAVVLSSLVYEGGPLNSFGLPPKQTCIESTACLTSLATSLNIPTAFQQITYTKGSVKSLLCQDWYSWVTSIKLLACRVSTKTEWGFCSQWYQIRFITFGLVAFLLHILCTASSACKTLIISVKKKCVHFSTFVSSQDILNKLQDSPNEGLPCAIQGESFPVLPSDLLWISSTYSPKFNHWHLCRSWVSVLQKPSFENTLIQYPSVLRLGMWTKD